MDALVERTAASMPSLAKDHPLALEDFAKGRFAFAWVTPLRPIGGECGRRR
jgi:hypothetical protein